MQNEMVIFNEKNVHIPTAKLSPVEYIYGKHAVLTAFKNRRECVLAVYGEEKYREELDRHHFPLKKLNAEILRKIPKEAVHQGIVAEIDLAKFIIDFRAWKHTIHEPDSSMCVVALAELNDPQNIGAIIRSAVAFGVSAVLVQAHRGAGITGAVAKVSAGTIFSIPVVEVSNLNTALSDMKKLGFWVYGLDAKGDLPLPKETFTKPTVFVVGNEAEGMRQKTQETCDSLIAIPMKGPAESLNVSASATVAFYVWSTNHLSG